MKTITSKDITQGDWKLKAYGGELQISTDSHTINGTTICYLNEDTTEIKANAKAIANLPNLLKENESLRAINDELLELVIEMDKDYNGLSFQDRLTDEGKLVHEKIKLVIKKSTNQTN